MNQHIQLKDIDPDIVRILNAHGYEIKKNVGKGGFAQVFKVFSNKYQSFFAAKCFKLGESLNHHEISSYSAEVSALRSLYHPNIISIYEHFSQENYLFIILEYCPNGTLSRLIVKNHLMAFPILFYIAKSIILALTFCHERSISHKDIKPSNVLIDSHQRLKLADFGLSQKTRGTSVLRFCGSLPFLPPEILQRQAHNPFAADVWSLGVLFYLCAKGTLPFHGKTESEILASIYSSLVHPSYPISILNTPSFPMSKIISMNVNDPNPLLPYKPIGIQQNKTQLFKHSTLAEITNKALKAVELRDPLYNTSESTLYSTTDSNDQSDRITRTTIRIDRRKNNQFLLRQSVAYKKRHGEAIKDQPGNSTKVTLNDEITFPKNQEPTEVIKMQDDFTQTSINTESNENIMKPSEIMTKRLKIESNSTLLSSNLNGDNSLEKEFMILIEKMLSFNPDERPTMAEINSMPLFKTKTAKPRLSLHKINDSQNEQKLPSLGKHHIMLSLSPELKKKLMHTHKNHHSLSIYRESIK